jgi:hypothetical protein
VLTEPATALVDDRRIAVRMLEQALDRGEGETLALQ